MFIVIGFNDTEVKLENTEGNEIETVSWDEVARRLLNNIEIDGLSFNEKGDIVDRNGNVLNKSQVKEKRKNSNLHKAKEEKNDEFYTRLEDIEAELSHYDPSYFKDKVIYCPTDVAVNEGRVPQSQFVRYFQINAHRLQFKKLIATCLVYKAVGETDEDLEKVHNCYILERQEVTKQQKLAWSHTPMNMVIGVKEDMGLKYVNEDGSTHPMPYHIVNQAVTAPEGKFTIVKRFIDHYDQNTGEPILGKEDKGIKWEFNGHQLGIKWCRKHPDGTEEMLPEECYYDNTTPTGEDFLTDFSIFPKDENGNPCFEDLDSLEDKGSVALYPPEYYDYQEIDYDEYEEYYEHCPADSEYVSGDYRSEYCQKLFKETDVVVTNPPFSLFRDFVAMLMEHEKKFLIIGNMNALTYKEIFPLFRDDKLWYGASIHSGDRKFGVPDSYPLDAAGCGIDENGQRYIKVKGVRWFTNLDYAARHEKLVLWKEYNSEEYPKYDNYDAINVNKYSEIPMNYDGVMGVPITFMDFYCPEQFEIVAFRKGDNGKDLVFTRDEEREFNRTFVSLYDVDSRDDKKRRRQNQWEAYLRENNNQTEIEPIDLFYPIIARGCVEPCINLETIRQLGRTEIKSRQTKYNGVLCQKTYHRLLIRKKADA